MLTLTWLPAIEDSHPEAAVALSAPRLTASTVSLAANHGQGELKWDTHDMMLQLEDELHGMLERW